MRGAGVSSARESALRGSLGGDPFRAAIRSSSRSSLGRCVGASLISQHDEDSIDRAASRSSGVQMVQPRQCPLSSRVVAGATDPPCSLALRRLESGLAGKFGTSASFGTSLEVVRVGFVQVLLSPDLLRLVLAIQRRMQGGLFPDSRRVARGGPAIAKVQIGVSLS